MFNLAERRPVGYVKVYEPPGRREEDDLDEEGHDYDYRHVAKEMTHIPSNHTVRIIRFRLKPPPGLSANICFNLII